MKSTNKSSWMLSIALVLAFLAAGCPLQKKPSVCKNPHYVEVMKEQAAVFYYKGNYLEALRSISQAEACKPKDPEVYYWLGRIYFVRGKSYDAIESFQQSLALDPGYTESLMGLGVVYLDLQRWDEAIACFNQALGDDFFARPWEAYNNMGWAYMQNGGLAAAELNLKQAVKQNDEFCPAHCNLGELYAKRGDRNAAILGYQKAIAVCPNNYARPHLLLAIEYGNLGFFTKACTELAAARSVENAPEAEQALEYMRLYNCPGVLR